MNPKETLEIHLISLRENVVNNFKCKKIYCFLFARGEDCSTREHRGHEAPRNPPRASRTIEKSNFHDLDICEDRESIK